MSRAPRFGDNLDWENQEITTQKREQGSEALVIPLLTRFAVALMGVQSYSYSMKWYSYSPGLYRVRVRVPLKLSTSKKLQTNGRSRPHKQ